MLLDNAGPLESRRIVTSMKLASSRMVGYTIKGTAALANLPFCSRQH
jgi:hypothetical protein